MYQTFVKPDKNSLRGKYHNQLAYYKIAEMAREDMYEVMGSPIRKSASIEKATPVWFFYQFFIVLTVTEGINRTLHAPIISHGGVT
jgi:hypothetical protein